MQNAGIVRNRLKINSIIKNAKSYLNIEQSGIPFNEYIWQFFGDKTIVNNWPDMTCVPTSTPESNMMAKALKKQGFSFVGSAICYVFMLGGGDGE